MYAYCHLCNYDSGDYESMEEIAQKVKQDNGRVEEVVHKEPNGKEWINYRLKCPKCKKPLNID